jgi:hypothetical protein
MFLSLYLTGRLTAVSQVPGRLAGPPAAPTPGASSGSGGVNLNQPATPIPGLGDTLTQWIGWAKTIGMFAGVIGFIICGVMMMIGRRNRSHLAAEGASGLVWVIAGASVVVMAPGVISAMMGG